MAEVGASPRGAGTLAPPATPPVRTNLYALVAAVQDTTRSDEEVVGVLVDLLARRCVLALS